ncbi:hypothetical protein XELAEV_18028842mg [Xenopus laevis]|uniref:Uncharacterized protein n=1 Tax=Xenopus laevis TaxID=8355 RepID=A0A974HH08_XENLA|nr:hypothetical protein XELAEV_18028842mg [Xenopus laevis]
MFPYGLKQWQPSLALHGEAVSVHESLLSTLRPLTTAPPALPLLTDQPDTGTFHYSSIETSSSPCHSFSCLLVISGLTHAGEYLT